MSLIKHTTEIVKSYLSHNRVAPQDVTGLIESVHQSLLTLSAGDTPSSEPGEFSPQPLSSPSEPVERWVPAVPIDQAVTEDTIYCLICGKASKAIKGHLTKTHRIDIPTYRASFGLAKDFPMVAPSYSETRRQLALAAGQGEILQAGRERKKKS